MAIVSVFSAITAPLSTRLQLQLTVRMPPSHRARMRVHCSQDDVWFFSTPAPPKSECNLTHSITSLWMWWPSFHTGLILRCGGGSE